MFFQKLAVGDLKLWLEGNLPRNLRISFREVQGFDPVFRSGLEHLMVASFLICALFLAALAVVSIGHNQINRQGVINAMLIGAGSTILLSICFMVAANFGGGRGGSQARFSENLVSAKGYLKLSSQDIAVLTREELQRHASKCLEDFGRNLRAAELRLPSYHPDREKLRTDFEKRYSTFLALGMIEDVGYSLFIPAP